MKAIDNLIKYMMELIANILPDWLMEISPINHGVNFIINTPDGIGSGQIYYSEAKCRFTFKASSKGNAGAAQSIVRLAKDAVNKGIPFLGTKPNLSPSLPIPLRDAFTKLVKDLERQGFNLCKSRDIPYGHQGFFSYDNEVYGMNIYYSKSKGLTVQPLLGQKLPSEERFKLILSSSLPRDKENDWNVPFKRYIGIDEVGKGDYFGPLVVAGFIMNEEDKDKLISLGIKDSKLLTDKQIKAIAYRLETEFKGDCIIKVFLPSTYNKLYQRFTSSGQTLNNLLAWAHSTVLKEGIERDDKIEGVLSDQFGEPKMIYTALKKVAPSIKVRVRTKGEANVAVAAASILARSRFLFEMEMLGKKYDIKIPLGGGSEATKAAGQAEGRAWGTDTRELEAYTLEILKRLLPSIPI